MSHDHSHGHDGHSHHDHDHNHDDDITPALQTLIYQQIDFDKIRTLNECEPNAGAKVAQKTWAQRMEVVPELVSDADEQLLMFIPFTGSLKLHSLLIRTLSDSSAPRTLKLFSNKDDLDFSTASEIAPTQSLDLSQTSEIQEFPVRRALFGNTYSLTLFIEDNFGDDVSRIYYIGFKGEFMNLSREPVEVLYEKAANPKDHVLAAGVGERGISGNRHGI